MGQSSRKMGAVRTACAEIQPEHQVLTGLTVQFLKKDLNIWEDLRIQPDLRW